MNVIIRVYGDGRLIFEDRIDFDAADIDPAVLAEQHAEKVEHHEKHMVEFEWLDEPDPMQRFTRFGTDKSMMVMPMVMPDLE